MAIESYPFDDNPTTEAQFSAMFRHLQDSGVASNNDLLVSANSSGMSVNVQPGEAFVRGIFFRSTATETLAIASSAANPRIDRVILRLDPANNQTSLTVKEGTAATNPSPPSMTQTDSAIYELPLANVRVGANVVTISADAVTDRRTFTGHRLRRWTMERRPVNPALFESGFNLTTGAFEVYNGTEWFTVPMFDATLPGYTIHRGVGDPSATLGVDGDLYFGRSEVTP